MQIDFRADRSASAAIAHHYDLVDSETGLVLSAYEAIVFADDATGVYGVYVEDPAGGYLRDPETGAPVIETRAGAIKFVPKLP